MMSFGQFWEASSYSRPVDFKKLRFLYDQVVDHAGRQGRSPGDLRALDLGAGAGAIALPLASLVGHVDAVDIDAPALGTLRSRLVERKIDNVAVFEQDATRFAAAPGSYDVVIASEMIANVPDPKALLANIAALLKPEGLLLLTVTNGFGPWEMRNRHLNLKAHLRRSNRLRRLLGKPGYAPGTGPDVAHFFHYREVLDLLQPHFRLQVHRNSDWMASVLFVMDNRRLGSIDSKIADRLPTKLVSGWYLALARSGPTERPPSEPRFTKTGNTTPARTVGRPTKI